MGWLEILGPLFVGLVLIAALGYRLSAMYAARAPMNRETQRLRREIAGFERSIRGAADDLSRAGMKYVETWRLRRRRLTPIEALRDVGADRVRWGALRQAGINTLADLDTVHASRLQALHGIGPASAAKIGAAALHLRARILDAAVEYPDDELGESEGAKLVDAAMRSMDARTRLSPRVEDLKARRLEFDGRTKPTAARLGFWAWIRHGFGTRQDLEAMSKARELAVELRAFLESDFVSGIRAEQESVFVGARSTTSLRGRYAAERAAVEKAIAAAAPTARFARAEIVPETVPMNVVPLKRSTGFSISVQLGSSAPEVIDVPFDVSYRAERVSEHAPSYGGTTIRWVPPGEAVTVAGYHIPGGMLYVGREEAYRADPCLINPALPVDHGNVDRAGAGMPYWPSYSTIAAWCRSAYLEWLAGGRRDASFGVGYAFLFLYGVERRLLREREGCRPGEVEALLAEVERLLGLYGGVRSFRGYAGSFLAAMRATVASPRLYEGPAPPHGETSQELRVGLGQAAADGEPLPAAWALAWYCADGTTRYSYAASRCPKELSRLFAARYAKELGEGLVVPAGKAELRLIYKPASAAFHGEVAIPTGLPDVVSRTVPKQIGTIAESCVRDLEPYARSRGRKGAAAGELSRIALLPAELVPAHADERLAGIRAWLEETTPLDAPILVKAGDLFSRWTDAPTARLKKKDVTELAQVLGRLGFGIDPDPRFDGGAVAATERVALFRVPQNAPATPSAAYPAAALIIRLCAAVAVADDGGSRGEREHVEEIASAMEGLEAPERARLRAFAVRLFETKAALGSLAKRVAAFPPEARERLGSLLVGVAAVDGRVSPKEIALLAKVYSALGLDPASVYRDAHARATHSVPAEEPVVVRRPEASRAAGEYAIPAPRAAPKARPSGVRIDEQLLARKQAETAEVLSMLAPIFAEESAASPAPPLVPSAADDPGLPGLDAKHAALLRRLAERGSWSRDEVEGVCEDLGLLTDGALETVNDAAFERGGAPVLEGDDPVEVDLEAVRSWTT